MELLVSPWKNVFLDFARSINGRATIVSPYISAEPLEKLATCVPYPESTQFRILTKLESSSILHGSLDLNAIHKFRERFPAAKVDHLPALHAKVYIADDHTAIITSGNLTAASLARNLEYGVRINDKARIAQISEDILEYGKFGYELSMQKLEYLRQLSNQLANTYKSARDSTEFAEKRKFEHELNNVQDSIKELRGESGASTASIFRQTVLYVLKDGPLSTKQIHLFVQDLQPDLCDDLEDRVISGIHFGKKWKHHLRNAQQQLKRNNQVIRVDDKWQLR